MLADPDSYDASEEQFAASLDQRSVTAAQPFIVDDGGGTEKPKGSEDSALRLQDAVLPAAGSSQIPKTGIMDVLEGSVPQQGDLIPADDAWRREVAAKLSRYRSRKRAPAPRYPSLQLRFDAPEPACEERIPQPVQAMPSRLAVALQETAAEPEVAAVEDSFDADMDVDEGAGESGAKILEFPRFFSRPEPAADELAEAVFDSPRILDVPEHLPPPPALGGIHIENDEEAAYERRPGFELPLNPPPMQQRLAAGIIDFLMVGISCATFGTMFFRMAHTVPPLKQATGVGSGLLAMVWVVYQYLLLVHSGTTPGLKLAGLQLSRFDGSPAGRSLRRWRALASVLSGLSLALGYAWCFLDEDQLCWHDRITRTYMANVPAETSTATGPIER